MPTFAIEVPGEANPLDEAQLLRTLSSAASTDPQQIQTGTKQLTQWEKYPTYYRHLQSAYLDHGLPTEVRYLAVILLKNGIDKYWRKTASNAVSREDKDAIRSRLIDSALNEPLDQLALQNALVIAKVARFEFPHDWPDLLSSISATLRSQVLAPQQLTRLLLVLLQIVKELSTGRLQRTRQTLQTATPELVHALGELYSSTVGSWLSSAPSEQTVPLMSLSLMSLKVLRRLLITGYEHPNRDSEVSSLWNITQYQLGGFFGLYRTSEGDVRALIQKHMVQLAKFHLEMAREHPAAFAMLPNSLDLTRAYWNLTKEFGEKYGSKEPVLSLTTAANESTNAEKPENLDKLPLKALSIIRACLKMVHNPAQTFKYRTPEDKTEKNQATEILRDQLFTQAFVQDVMDVVVTKFLVFRKEDLQEWQEEPEEWERREEGFGEDWEFSIRSCSEKLFLDLAINYKEILAQPLLQVFYSVARPENDDILFKESVYCAIGLAAPVLHEMLDFDAFIREVLVKDVQRQSPGSGLIRRRVAILLGQWISVKVSTESTPTVHEIFLHLLNTDDALNDQVVRITAGRQFKNIVDSWEFDPASFMHYSDEMLARLIQLTEEVELSETKISLLSTISVIIERMDHRIGASAQRIVNMLPTLWKASGEEHLMKQAILTILARLINALKAQSLPIHSIILPIIRGALVPDSDTQVYLLDDAMDTWAAILAQSTLPVSEELLSLVPYLYPIYKLGSENLRKALEITESYVLLTPDQMFADEKRRSLLEALSELLFSVKPAASGLVCNLIEVIIRSAENLGGEKAVKQMCDELVDPGILPEMLKRLKARWHSRGARGGESEATLDTIVETDYFSIFARLVLGSLQGFCAACVRCPVGSTTEDNNINPHDSLDATMSWLLDEWFLHFENIGNPSRRKLHCLALTTFLDAAQSWILKRLQDLMNTWTDVITELREEAEDVSGAQGNKTGPMSDSLVLPDPGPAVYEGSEETPEAPEDGRRRLWTYSDVVHTVNLPMFVKAKLQNAIGACGGPEEFQREWLVNVDGHVLQAFSGLGIME